jgi:hypothetical protein
MKRTLIITLSIIFLACEKQPKIPDASKVIAKYVVFEDSISSKIIKDLKKVKEFDNSNEDYKHPFKLNKNIYQFETEFKLDSEGRLAKIFQHEYHSFNYSDLGLKSLDLNKETIGQTLSIKFTGLKNQIIDCDDTLEIEKIFPENKLIFVTQNRNDGRKTIYEYR